jgi:hypothetical protein
LPILLIQKPVAQHMQRVFFRPSIIGIIKNVTRVRRSMEPASPQ